MQFDSLADFIHMNGHGIYVWTVYFLGLAVLVMNVLRPKIIQKNFYREQKKALDVQMAIKADQEDL